MNLSGYEFQVIFCVLILLSLASVALVVDYLKGMNEKLRERHIDLMARHETVVQRVEEDNTKLLRALAEQSKTFREMTRNSVAVNTIAAGQTLPEITLEPIAQPVAPQKIDEIPVVAESGTVAVADLEPAPVESAEESLPSNVIRIRLKSNDSSEPARVENTEPNFEKFLEDLVTEFEEPVSDVLTSQSESIGSLAHHLGSFEDSLQVPSGTHPPSTLNQLINATAPFTGLVVAVGINEYMKLDEIHGRAAAEELLNTVDALMGEVAGETGFCSRSSDDEFVLIFPKLNGAASQQRLSEISEKLWDYQLQSLGTFSVVFSWGASESQRQPLTAALNIATENMAETRSSRKHTAAETDTKRRATA